MTAPNREILATGLGPVEIGHGEPPPENDHGLPDSVWIVTIVCYPTFWMRMRMLFASKIWTRTRVQTWRDLEAPPKLKEEPK